MKLRIVLNADGRVKNCVVTKTSGDGALDEAAQRSVLKWQLKRAAIKPDDLTKGRDELVEFKQEALLAAVYPDRKAFFEDFEGPKHWMYAPFPSYPLDERRLYHTGTVWLYGRIDHEGRVTDVRILQSSGYSRLDQCAVVALRLWRAHKEFARQQFKIPITFVMGGRRF